MKLIVLKNNVPVSEVELDTADLSLQYEFFIGRADDCHVFIDDPLISRHHVVIRNEGSQWLSEKLTQLGVVTVNGSAATISVLSQGAEIKCGPYSILVTQLDGGGAQTASPQAPAYQPQPTKTRPPVEDMPEDDLPVMDEMSETLDISADDLSSTPQMESLDDEDSLAAEPEEVQPSDLTDELTSSDNSSDMEQSLVPDDFGAQEGELGSDFGNSDEQGGELSAFSEDLPAESGADDGDERTRVDQFFVNYQLTLFGEHAPYDRYQISTDETYIGRDEKKCQIVLNDPEVSSVHAVIRRSRIDVVLEDLNSSNGTILNGERINRAQIAPGDEFVIGGTSFTLEVQSELLAAEQNRLMPVEKNQVVEREEIEEEVVDLDNEMGFEGGVEEKNLLKRLWKNPTSRKRILLYGGVIALLLVFLVPEETSKPAPKTEAKKEAPKGPVKPQLSEEVQKRRNVAYEMGVDFFERSKYTEALKEFEVVMSLDNSYKNIQSYYEQTKAGLKRLEEEAAARRAEEQRILIKKEVEEILVKAREAVKEHQVELANTLLSQAIEKDPENTEVPQLRLELESWVKEQERIALEKAAKEAARKAMVDALNPGKTFYIKKEWYRAILKLEEFLQKKGMDEDLVKEASDMLSDAKNQLASDIGPILGKARSLKEGQDLKNAYEAFLEVLRIEPTNTEALDNVEEIRSMLDARSKKIYREAIIAESLSLFNDAKEKFQEVQQVSPTDSEYYKKATEKLKNYLE